MRVFSPPRQKKNSKNTEKKRPKKKPLSAERWLSDLVRLNGKPNRKTEKGIARAALRE